MGAVAQGGGEWQLYELMRRLDRDRFRPVLISIEFPSYQELVIGEGDRAIRTAYDALDVPHYKITGFGRNDPRNAREVLRVIRREKIAVVHTNLFAGELWGRVAAVIARVPIVTHKRGMPFKSRKPQNVLVDWGLNLLSRRIIVVNHTIRRELQRMQWLPSDRFTVVYPGIEPELWRPPDDAERTALRAELGLEGKLVVTTVGRLRPLKGQQYLLAAVPDILRVHPNAHVLFVGSGAQEDKLRSRAAAMGVERETTFLGLRRDVRSLLAATDVFVLPSQSEASPVALMEAAFVGVPSVATWVGGVPEVVREGRTGLLVPPRNPQALAEAVNELLSDEDRRREIGAAGQQWAAEQFDITRTVRQIEAEYERAAMS